jgi:hypothetical protein
MDSAEFTEWQAFYRLEPFGDLVADERHGVAVSVLANINRDRSARPGPFRANDFIHWRDTGKPDEDFEPILLDDSVAQSNLIRAAIFGKAPE